MTYHQTILLKDGRECLLRNGTFSDGKAVLENFLQTHGETDFLLTYPDENTFTPEGEAEFLRHKEESPNEIELVAVVDGKIAGTAGIDVIGSKDKIKHRAEFGISILKEYQGLGIGRKMTEICVECAKKAGYTQLELSVVSENKAAVTLYEKIGFTEYGRNPRGFHSRSGGYQELILMRLELR